MSHSLSPRVLNRLEKEKSPYLLQHAGNPVDWFPWGKEAFERAKTEDKPIFLSIGYSSCHWCHVMKEESFEDEKVAAFLNKHFISIKVDKEERPDIDEFYMKAIQRLTGSGGWPLSVFLTPDLEPFYGGTYFPPEPTYGLPSFIQILETIIDNWTTKKEEVKLNSKNFLLTLKQEYEISLTTEEINASILQEGFEHLTLQYDQDDKGFGSAPKFPMPTYLNFLLQYFYREKNKLSLKIVTSTLKAMAQGGIYDQLAGGFHRYSTDKEWRIPHFEKMLYDNALLATVYLNTYLNTHNPLYARIAKEVLNWILSEMTDSTGGFYSAVDADVNGEEGSHYAWTYDEVFRILGDKLGDVASQYFNIKKEGSFNRRNILYCSKILEELPTDQIRSIEDARRILLDERRKRKNPVLDDKIITGWNGLAISAMTLGYRVLEEERFVKAAESCGQFLLDTIWRNDQLFRYYRQGKAEVLGFLEDYSYLVSALIDLYETTFNLKYLKASLEINESMLSIFLEREKRGFYDIREDSELPIRIKNMFDGVIPSGNSVAVMNLLRLAEITYKTEYRDIAEKTILSYRDIIEEKPESNSNMLSAIDLFLSSKKEFVIASSGDESETKKILREIWSHYIPNKVVILVNPKSNMSELIEMVPLVKERKPLKGVSTVYICENFTCRRPMLSLEELKQELTEK